MKLEPNTFFVSIIDFFSVMLPGAVFTALVSREASEILFESGFPKYPQEATWVVFLFSSYLLGHFIFLIGSKIDTIYQRVRDKTKEDKKSASRLNKFLAVRVFPKDPEDTLRVVRMTARPHYARSARKPESSRGWSARSGPLNSKPTRKP